MSQLQQAIQLLRHSDPEKRRKAIAYLAKSGEQDAIKALAWSYKNDPNPDLRELARKGGAHLKKQLEASSPSSPTGGKSSLLSSYEKKKATREQPMVDPAFSFEDEEETVSDYDYNDSYDSYTEKDDELDSFFGFEDEEDYDYNEDYEAETGPINYDARRHIKRAMDYHIEGEDEAALEQLVKAIEIDRRALEDDQAINVAASATGLRGDEAIKQLASPLGRAQLLDSAALDDGEEKKKKRGSVPTWGNVSLDLLIYGLVNIAGIVILIIIGANRIFPLLTEIQAMPDYQAAIAESGGEDPLALFTEYGNEFITFFIVAGIINALFGIVGIIIHNFAMHFAASNIFNGKNAFTVTMSGLLTTQTVFSVLGYLVAIGFIFALPANAEAMSMMSEDTLASFGLGASCLSLIFVIAFYAIQSVTLGRAHDFGFGKGCLSMIVGFIFYMIASCMLQFVLQIFGTMAGVALG